MHEPYDLVHKLYRQQSRPFEPIAPFEAKETSPVWAAVTCQRPYQFDKGAGKLPQPKQAISNEPLLVLHLVQTMTHDYFYIHFIFKLFKNNILTLSDHSSGCQGILK